MFTPKTQDDVYDEMKAEWQAEEGGGDLTNWSTTSRLRILLWVIAGVFAYVYDALQTLFLNIFPTTGDSSSLYWWYQTLGLDWDDPAEEEARAEVEEYFRTPAIGTQLYYETNIPRKFAEVDRVMVVPGWRQPNGLLLFVTRNGKPVADSVITSLENYYDTTSRKAAGQALFFRTGSITETPES